MNSLIFKLWPLLIFIQADLSFADEDFFVLGSEDFQNETHWLEFGLELNVGRASSEVNKGVNVAFNNVGIGVAAGWFEKGLAVGFGARMTNVSDAGTSSDEGVIGQGKSWNANGTDVRIIYLNRFFPEVGPLRHWLSVGSGLFYTNYELPQPDAFGATQREDIDHDYSAIEIGTSLSVHRTRIYGLSPQITVGQTRIKGAGGCFDDQMGCEATNKDEVLRTWSVGGVAHLESKTFGLGAGILISFAIAISGGI